MTEHDDFLAEQDFYRARLQELFHRLGTMLDPARQQLLALDEVKAILKIKGEEYRGLVTVPVELIVGSEGRYRDFAQGFLPKFDHLRSRWVRVNNAHYQQMNLPPVRLYELGGVYFVRDGNHRVSVARMQGILSIDAEVTALGSTITIQKGMTIDDLKTAVIDHEKREFYAQTLFGQITDDPGLDFSVPGSYDLIVEHILVHKYYCSEREGREVDFVHATDSKYRSVYLPIASTVKGEWLTIRFPGRTAADLYLYIVRYWDELKKTYGDDYSPEDAARDYVERYGKSIGDIMKDQLKRLLHIDDPG